MCLTQSAGHALISLVARPWLYNPVAFCMHEIKHHKWVAQSAVWRSEKWFISPLFSQGISGHMSIAHYFIWCAHQMVMFREYAVKLYQATWSDRYGLGMRLATHLLYDLLFHIISQLMLSLQLSDCFLFLLFVMTALSRIAWAPWTSVILF